MYKERKRRFPSPFPSPAYSRLLLLLDPLRSGSRGSCNKLKNLRFYP